MQLNRGIVLFYTKIHKKLYVLSLTIFFVFFLIGCEDNRIESVIIQEIELITLSENKSKEDIAQDLYFPNTLPSDEDVFLEYSSNKPDIISNNGTVKQPLEVESVVVVSVIVTGRYTLDFDIEYTVPPKIFELKIQVDIKSFQAYSLEETFIGPFFDENEYSLINLPEGYIIDYFIDIDTNEVIQKDAKIISSKTLEAITKLKSIQIHYYLEDLFIKTETYEYMDVYTSIYVPTKEGYTFYGWYYIDDFGNQVDLINNYTLIINHINAYPLWIKN